MRRPRELHHPVAVCIGFVELRGSLPVQTVSLPYSDIQDKGSRSRLPLSASLLCLAVSLRLAAYQVFSIGCVKQRKVVRAEKIIPARK